MAGDGGRAPDVTEQRAEAHSDVIRAAREVDALFDGEGPGRWKYAGTRITDDAAEPLLSMHDYLNSLAYRGSAPLDPASVLAALLAEQPDTTTAALEALLTTDEAVEAGASTIVKQDLLMRTDDSLMGALEVLMDPAREIYEDAIAAACRSLRPKAVEALREAARKLISVYMADGDLDAAMNELEAAAGFSQQGAGESNEGGNQ